MKTSPFAIIPALALCLIGIPAAHSAVTLFAQDLSGFNAAAGNPPVAIDFDSIAPGTDITGTTIDGVTFTGPGAPLIVVRGADTYTPDGFNGVIDASTNKLIPTSGENVLSPGGIVLGPGPDPAIESDDLTLDFATPTSAFGFDHLSQSADGFSFTQISVFDDLDNLLYSGIVPISNVGGLGGGAPAGDDFWGIASTSANIKRIVVDEMDDNNQYPDSNIGYDTIRIARPTTGAVPEPGSAMLLLTGLTGFLAARRRR